MPPCAEVVYGALHSEESTNTSSIGSAEQSPAVTAVREVNEKCSSNPSSANGHTLPEDASLHEVQDAWVGRRQTLTAVGATCVGFCTFSLSSAIFMSGGVIFAALLEDFGLSMGQDCGRGFHQ